MMLPVAHLRIPRREILSVIFVFAQFSSEPFFRGGEKEDGNDFNVSAKPKSIPDYLGNVRRREYVIPNYRAARGEDVISRYKRTGAVIFLDSCLESMLRMLNTRLRALHQADANGGSCGCDKNATAHVLMDSAFYAFTP